jgi:hypothetical protein
MQERHTDRSRYFEEQARTTEKYYIPYLISHIGPPADKVLEVGCGIAHCSDFQKGKMSITF